MKSLQNEHKEHFFNEGYYVARGVFQGDELKALRDAAQAIRERTEKEIPEGIRLFREQSDNNTIPELPKDQWGDYSWGINEITRPEFFNPTLINALGNPQVESILNGLLDGPRAWGLKLLWAPRKSHYNLHWHRDCDDNWGELLSHKPAGNDHVQFNAALEADSSFIVIPRTHRRELSVSERMAVSANDRTDEVEGQIRVELEPGDIVFMDAHSWHRGEAAVAAPRLSLHFSAQAQWVPLMSWGKQDHFNWITSDEFINQLDDNVKPYYERLRRACYAESQYGWLFEHAKTRGYDPALATQA